MTQNQDQFGSRDFAGKFEASDDVVVQHIASHPRVEDITNALIKYQFDRLAGIEATDDYGERILGASGGKYS